MSYGYGVSDVVALGQLAWSAYKACKDAPDSFGNIARETLSLHAVLHELEEALAGSPRMSTSQQQGLGVVCDGCSAVLKDLQALVQKYERLGTSGRRAWDRIQYATENVAELRSRLVSNTTLLSAFIANTQFIVERKLRRLLAEVQQGRFETSVFSEESIDSLSTDERQAWRDVRKALQDVGITPAAFEANKTFIVDFMKDAIAQGDLQEQPPSLPVLSPVETSTSSSQLLTEKQSPIRDSSARVGALSPDPTSDGPKIASLVSRFRRLSRTSGRKDDLRSSIESDAGRSNRNSRATATHDIILLGPRDAGKTTVLKQIQTIYTGPFTEQEIAQARTEIISDLLEAFRSAVLYELQVDWRSAGYQEEVTRLSRWMIEFRSREKNPDLSAQLISDLKTMLSYPSFAARITSLEREAGDDLVHIYEHMAEALPNDTPLSSQIIFHARSPSARSHTITIPVDSFNLKVTDTDGRDPSLTRSIKSLLDKPASTILFTIPVSAYNYHSHEKQDMTPVEASLVALKGLFDRYPQRKFVLLLTKIDLFRKKAAIHPPQNSLNRVRMRVSKNDGEVWHRADPLDADIHALRFVIGEFVGQGMGCHVDVHTTDATRTEVIRPCLERMIEFSTRPLSDGVRSPRPPDDYCCDAARIVHGVPPGSPGATRRIMP